VSVIHLLDLADAAFVQLLPVNILAVTYLSEDLAATPCRRLVPASSSRTMKIYPVDVPTLPSSVVSLVIYTASKNLRFSLDIKNYCKLRL